VTRLRILLVLAVAGASPAQAAPSRSLAVDHYEAGKRLFDQKQYASALEEFRLALAISPRPEVLYSMAQVQRLLGDCVNAVETYRAFLAGNPGEPYAEYARINIVRCERGVAPASDRGPGERSAWYHDVTGGLLVGAGAVTGLVGTLVWHAGRTAAQRPAMAMDYQDFVASRDGASSALTKQRLGVAAMVVGGAAIVGGILHYVYRPGAARQDASLTVSATPSSALLMGHVTF